MKEVFQTLLAQIPFQSKILAQPFPFFPLGKEWRNPCRKGTAVRRRFQPVTASEPMKTGPGTMRAGKTDQKPAELLLRAQAEPELR